MILEIAPPASSRKLAGNGAECRQSNPAAWDASRIQFELEIVIGIKYRDGKIVAGGIKPGSPPNDWRRTLECRLHTIFPARTLC